MDYELNNLIELLLKNKKVIGMVKILQPLDIVKIFIKDLSLNPKSASQSALDLIRHVHDVHYEGISLPSIETNKQFPVPSSLRGSNDSGNETEKLNDYENMDDLKEAGNYIDATPRNPISKSQTIPDARPEADEFPYDAMTVAAMDPANKGKKRPIMCGAFDQDLKKNQPGGDGAGGGGIQQRNSPHFRTNNQSISGRSWSKQGVPGWSKAPDGKTFEIPDDSNTQSTPIVGAQDPSFSPWNNVKRGSKKGR